MQVMVGPFWNLFRIITFFHSFYHFWTQQQKTRKFWRAVTSEKHSFEKYTLWKVQLKNPVVQGDISSLSVLQRSQCEGTCPLPLQIKTHAPPRILAPTSARTPIYFHKYSRVSSWYYWWRFWKEYWIWEELRSVIHKAQRSLKQMTL